MVSSVSQSLLCYVRFVPSGKLRTVGEKEERRLGGIAMGEARGGIVIDGFSTVKGSQPQCDLVSSLKSFCITSPRCNKRLHDCRCPNCYRSFPFL